MPTYNPKAIEPRWQRYWEAHKTFRTPDGSDKPKFYILDMFPYPSGSGLHVGHPEGYTATDILARYRRMKGFNVLHPMGWDAFGLPAEQYAIETGTHPRLTTQKNIDEFRRQIKMLGFSYDWDREVDTTDPNYYKWTQWIFLQIFDTWYDEAQKRGRPIAELPIPPEVVAQGEARVRAYQDGKRLAYQVEAPVNWCPVLGTVLANEEVVDGKSERGGHPVERRPLRQWMLRITAYADRLLADLALVDWPEPIKEMQRNWIGRSEGAEVEFRLLEAKGEEDRFTVFTTRPDTLFGATYMVLAPEHPLVERITTPEQRPAVEAYRTEAARKSDLERTELAKKKTGVFTGAYAVNPVNSETIPIWSADYVLISYGTGAIMAVPAHDERDFAFAKQFELPIRAVVQPPERWLHETQVYHTAQKIKPALDQTFNLSPAKPAGSGPPLAPTLEITPVTTRAHSIWKRFNGNVDKIVEYLHQHHTDLFDGAYTGDGIAVNSGSFNGLATPEFKTKITAWLVDRGQGRAKVNTKLRDWLFSRQRYWGEPFPILHEVDAQGKPTGLVEPLPAAELPLLLPELEDYKPSGKPEPPLGKALKWMWLTRDDKHFRRETNTMPQWAGSCWYYLRYLDPRNGQSFCDPDKERAWMPVDLYVGGAEHAVLHLLYARFWHKVLFDRGHVHTPEPFKKLVNQGMILGESYNALLLKDHFVSYDQFSGREQNYKRLIVARDKVEVREEKAYLSSNFELEIASSLPQQSFQALVLEGVLVSLDKFDSKVHNYERVIFDKKHVEIRDGKVFAKNDFELEIVIEKMAKSRGNVIGPDEVVNQYGADSLRLYEMFMGPLEATKPWSMRGVEGVYRFLSRFWRLFIDDRADTVKLADTVQAVEPDRETLCKLHQTIQKVTEDLDAMRFNTAIAAMMEFANHLTKLPARPRKVLEPFVLLLSPFAPHLAEELWFALGHMHTLAYESWPTFDDDLTRSEEIVVPVQINGKLRSRVLVPADIDDKALQDRALADDKVRGLLEGKHIRKVIIVPGKLVNIVAG